MVPKAKTLIVCNAAFLCFLLLGQIFAVALMMMTVMCCRAVIAESEKRNIAGVLGEEIQTLHFQNCSLQEEVGM